MNSRIIKTKPRRNVILILAHISSLGRFPLLLLHDHKLPSSLETSQETTPSH